MPVTCEECQNGPREVFLQSKAGNRFDTRHVCAPCAGRILNTSRGWEIIDVDTSVVQRLRDRLDQNEPDVIRALLIIDYTAPAAVKPALTKAA